MGMGKNFFIWAGVFIALSLAVNLWGGDTARAGSEKLAFSEFMDKVENKQVAEVTITGASISGTATNGTKFYTYAPYDPTMVENLRKMMSKSMQCPKIQPVIIYGESLFRGFRCCF